MSGQYTIDHILGAGAYATVCVARDVMAPGDPPVALKVLKAAHLRDVDALSRIRDEARMLARVQHPAIVRVYRLLDFDGRPVIEMEWVDGVSCDDLLRASRGGLPARVVLELGRQVANALDAAFHGLHGSANQPMHVIHRDVKPSNVLLSRRGVVKVVDFGIAKGEFADRQAKSLYLVPGSIGFDAPERKTGGSSPAIDVYGLGVTLFMLLTGRTLLLSPRPERHDSGATSQLSHLELEGVDTPATRMLLAQMVRHDPADRPRMAEVEARLLALLGATPVELASYAAAQVEPLVAARRVELPAREHSSWEDVSFLETSRPTPPRRPLSVAQAEAKVRAFLKQPDWEQRVPELQRILVRSPRFVERPFCELLERVGSSRLAFWKSKPRPEQVEAMLLVLCDHPSAKLVALVRPLAGHSDPRIAAAAAFFLRGAESASL